MTTFTVGDGIGFQDRKGKLVRGVVIAVELFRGKTRLVAQTAGDYRWKLIPELMPGKITPIKLKPGEAESIQGKQIEWDARNEAGKAKRREHKQEQLSVRDWIKPGAVVKAYSQTFGWYQTQVVKINRTTGKVSVVSRPAQLKGMLGGGSWRLARKTDIVALDAVHVQQV